MSLPLAPYNIWRAITISNTANFKEGLCDAVYCGSTGNIVLVMQDDSAVTFTGVFSGQILPVTCKRVNDTNTTVTGMVALYCR